MSFEFGRSSRRWCLCAVLFAATGAISTAQSTASRHREFAPGALERFEELPTGRFRSQLDGLPQAARQTALEWLQGFHFTELDLETLHADAEGGIFYADIFPAEPAIGPAEAPVIGEAAVAVSPFPTNLV